MRSRWCRPSPAAKRLESVALMPAGLYPEAWAELAAKVPFVRMGKKLIKSLYTFPCELLHTFAIIGECVLCANSFRSS